MAYSLLVRWTSLALGLGASLLGFDGRASAPPRATDPRCEYARDPLAIETPRPRLSWVVEPAQGDRAVVQAAYQVLVATDLARLAQDQGDLWDSGEVVSDQSVHIVYAGKPLESGQACYWKVRLWDSAGQASPYSDPARWGMGLLKASDWQAKWIGYDSAPSAEDAAAAAAKRLLQLEGQSWLWVNGAKPGSQPAGKAYFRKVIQIPSDRAVSQALFLLTADDAFQLYVNGHPAGQGSSWKTLVSVEVTGRLQPGANALGLEATNDGETPSPAGVLGRLVVTFARGDPLVVPIDGSWQTSLVAADRWNWADFDASAWKPASAVGTFGGQPWGKLERDAAPMEPAPFFRKAFTVAKPVKRAMVFASALGVFQLHLNGQPVDTDGPGFKRIVIRPEIVSGQESLDWVRASYRSIRGEIRSAWKLAEGRFELELTVPGNCQATVYVPAKGAEAVTEGGKPAAGAAGVKLLRHAGGKAIFEVGSGQYAFRSEL